MEIKPNKKSKLNADLIYGFVGSCLASRFDGNLPTPECHKEWWELCCSENKYVAIAAPRGHAKSTAITLSYTLANVLFRERKFVLIVSDTEAQANLFLGGIKTELQDNPDIIELFGLKKNIKKEVQFIKDSESDVIVEFADGEQFRIIAKGAEQKLRGLLWNGKRPDLIVLDDLENDEIVMNKDRREKFRRWFYGALLPSLALDGRVRYVGTILHMDSMLERLMPKEHDKMTVFDALRTWTKKKSTLWTAVKYRAHDALFTNLLWQEKFSAENLRKIREEYTSQGIPDVYSQEYLNIPIDESVSFFKKADFLPLREEDKKQRLNYYVAVDAAISEKDRADYTAIVVGGIDPDGYLQIKNVIRDRMDGRQIVDTLIQVQKLYDPVLMAIEQTQITKAIGPFLREAMHKSNVYMNILELNPHRTDKLMRARSIQARMKAGAVKFDKHGEWYDTFEEELLKFPRGRHDDQVDAMAYLGLTMDKYVEAPTKEEVEQEEYEDELEKSGLNKQGMNATCGY